MERRSRLLPIGKGRLQPRLRRPRALLGISSACPRRGGRQGRRRRLSSLRDAVRIAVIVHLVADVLAAAGARVAVEAVEEASARAIGELEAGEVGAALGA